MRACPKTLGEPGQCLWVAPPESANRSVHERDCMLGVLIMNTGTPDAPNPKAIRPYLRQFLSDRNLIDVPPVVWQPILNLAILPWRPRRTAHFYQEIWTPQGSPFLLTSQALCSSFAKRLSVLAEEGALGPHTKVRVALGMRYGNPSAEAGLRELREAGVDTVVVLPLYPHKTRACAVTCFEEFDRAYAKVFGVSPSAVEDAAAGAAESAFDSQEATGPDGSSAPPRIVRIESYWEAPGYISALAAAITRSWDYTRGSKLVVSFHSIPMSHAEAGDPYPEHTLATARMVGDELGIPRGDVRLTYQSRFDRRTWLGPMLEPTLSRLAKEQVKNVAVVCPGFSVDNLETLHEVAVLAKQHFEDECVRFGNEGAHFSYIPALEDDPALVEAVSRLIASRLSS